MQDFFEWHGAIPAKLRIFVPGNHDRIFNTDPARARNLVPGSIVLLESSDIEYDGIKFYSVPARPYLKGPNTLPNDIDFLITHGPAYGYLDLAIAGARPKYHIFGHVHEEGLQRKAMLGSTTFLNVSYFEELRKLL